MENELYIPSKNFIGFYQALDYFFMTLSVVLFSVTTFAIVKTPVPYLTLYRYFLLHEIIWAFLFDLMITLVIPVVHLPHICYQPSGFLKNALSYYGAYCFIYILVLLLVGKAYSMFLCCFHRYAVAHQHTKYSVEPIRYLSQFRLPFTPILYYVLFCITVAELWIPIYIYSRNPMTATEALQHKSPEIRRLLDEYPGMTCLISSEDYKYVILAPICILVFWGIGILFLLATMVYVIKTDPKAYMSTLRLQWMLFRSLLAQLGATLIFMYFPLLIWLILAYNESKYSMIAGVVALCLLSTHSCVDCLLIMVYVRPFRLAIRRLFRADEGNSINSRSNRSVVTIAIRDIRRSSSIVNLETYGRLMLNK